MAKRPSSGFALALAVAFTAAGGCARGRAAEDGRGPKAVKAHVVPVASRSVQRTVDSVGSLFPFEEVTVGAEVEGRVAQVFVDVGDAVARGRALVKIVPVELGLTLEQERAALEQIQTRLTTSGGGVLKDPKEAAEVKRADADRTDAEQKYLRAKELFAQGLIPAGPSTRRRRATTARGPATTWPCRTCSPCAPRPPNARRPWPSLARSSATRSSALPSKGT